MKSLHLPFNQFRLVVILTSLAAVIYVLTSGTSILRPVLFFSAFLVSCINIAEVFYKKGTSAKIKALHVTISLAFVTGFIYSMLNCINA